MGISDLGAFIRKQDTDCDFELPLTYFSGTAWGIDALNWVYTYKTTCVKIIIEKRNRSLFDPISGDDMGKEMERQAYYFNKKLLDCNIIPVWIWDGEAQDNKTATKEKRQKDREKLWKKHKELEAKLRAKDEMEITPWEEKAWKQSLANNTKIPYDRVERIKKMTTDLGIPTITSDDEAENLAASLSIEGKISLVWSTDTDNYPLGSIKLGNGKFTYKNGIPHIKGVEPQKVVKKLGMDFKTFRDFCIMLGTDFNVRIRGIGPAKSLKMIRKYGNLETIEKETDYNLTFWNYPFVRKQLTPYSTYFQTNIHLKPRKCHDPDVIDMLRKDYSHLNLYELFSSLNDVRHVDCFSPVRMSPCKIVVIDDDESE